MRFQDGFLRALSLVLLAAAVFGTFFAWVVYAFGVSGDSSDGTAGATLTWQLVTGVFGVVPAAAMVYFSFTSSNRKAVAALAIGLLVWAAWGVLNDAAVHGWGRDNFVVGLFG